MITGGLSESVGPLKVKSPRLKDKDKDAIVFTERDAEGVLALHSDAVVVTANITDFNIHYFY